MTMLESSVQNIHQSADDKTKNQRREKTHTEDLRWVIYIAFAYQIKHDEQEHSFQVKITRNFSK